MLTGPIAEVAVEGGLAIVKNLKPELKLDTQSLDMEQIVENRGSSKSITHKFKMQGEYSITKADNSHTNLEETSARRKKKWWQCGCFGR